jgi:hypothetical protein
MVDYKLLRKQITALEHLISDYPDDHILWGLINYLEDVIDKND